MDSKHPLMGPLGISIGAIVIIALVITAEVPALINSTGTAASSGAPESDTVAELASQHELAMNMDRDRFNGRSFFYRPAPPPRPRPKVEPTNTPPPPPPPPPPPVDPKPVKPTYPKNYTGPDLKAIIGPTAFFQPSGGDLIVVNVGETKEDIELLGTTPPSNIEVKYRGGGPYSVPLFDLSPPEFLTGDEIDSEDAASAIVVDTRDGPEEVDALEGTSGWPAGTIAGDPVRVVYRQGPYEGAVRGILARANNAWLVIDVDGRENPMEIYKADILSIQNLSPAPPEPEQIPETEEPGAAEIQNSNDNSTVANPNSNTSTPVVSNDNASIAPANQNSTVANGNASNAVSMPTATDVSNQNDNATQPAEDAEPAGDSPASPSTDG